MQKIDIININANGHAKEITLENEEERPEERHTEDIQEIITKVPSWILRWGIMLFFGILLMVAAISVFVRYPDTIKGNLKITSPGITMPVTTVAAAKITRLAVQQGSTVKKGQPIVYAETLSNPAEQFTLIAPQDGKVGFIAILQPGALLRPNQEVFIIHPMNEQFFGVMEIPAGNINKIRTGQQVLINLRNFPEEEYGRLKGTISYIADEPGKEGFFAVKVTLNMSDLRHVALKSWMTGDAEIITQDVSLSSRLFKSIFQRL